MAREGSKHGKGGRSVHSSTTSSPSTSAPSSPVLTFCGAMMEENMLDAEDIFTLWDPERSSSAKMRPLFCGSRTEARRFLRAVDNLQRAMKFFAEDSSRSGTAAIIRCQNLMQAAMRRLRREFHQILSAKRDTLDSESMSAPHRVSRRPPASLRSPINRRLHDLSGYGKECVDIYRLVRRSVVEEGLYKLGFDKSTPSQVQRLGWDLLENRIWNWVAASKVAVRVLFSGERTVFAEIAAEAATMFFGFPELVVSKAKFSPEKIFRLLDIYETILDLLPDIESLFSYQSTSAVRSQVVASLLKVGEVVRFLFDELESSIQKEHSKEVISGGGLHPLAPSTLEDVFAEHPVEMSAESLLEAGTFMSAPPSPSSRGGEGPLSTVSLRIGWLIFVLLCKLDTKAERYGEPALGYLFLANNLHYIVNKVRRCKLSDLLGDDWMATHAARARRFAANYERLAWNDVLGAIPADLAAISEMDADAAELQMRRFNDSFDAACRRQASWVVTDRRMAEELKLSIAGKVISAYRPFYVRCRGEGSSGGAVRFAPEDLANYISDLFCADAGSSVSSGSGSSKDASSRRSAKTV
ncbi:unnamed protein product [Spirodela intermedia]|uniref:Exocyst subunit Exo70 family protein n=1 Tax=Spirodela intermedia TaxID=51605 RepID=A0A7I8IHJ2_SPIIN|nr:unnamed protein product [Spirodela intermedia]CAA6656846.1 unnamed protein product [Spirodela intermedia]